MDHTPARPTNVKTIRVNAELSPPKIHATKSKAKIPILPQFRAPTITRTNAILSITIINITSPLFLPNKRKIYIKHIKQTKKMTKFEKYYGKASLKDSKAVVKQWVVKPL